MSLAYLSLQKAKISKRLLLTEDKKEENLITEERKEAIKKNLDFDDSQITEADLQICEWAELNTSEEQISTEDVIPEKVGSQE